jgi:hypothetical protein
MRRRVQLLFTRFKLGGWDENPANPQVNDRNELALNEQAEFGAVPLRHWNIDIDTARGQKPLLVIWQEHAFVFQALHSWRWFCNSTSGPQNLTNS